MIRQKQLTGKIPNKLTPTIFLIEICFLFLPAAACASGQIAPSDIMYYLKQQPVGEVTKALKYPEKAATTSTRGVVAITFDDGPNPKTTPQILETLKKHQVKVTFFLLGERAAKYPDLVKRISAEGHDLGNHTYNHTRLSTLSKKDIEREIVDTQNIIKKISEKNPVLFRPPYGTINDDVISITRKHGLKIVLWSVDPQEYDSQSTKERVMKVIEETIRPNSIILSHDTKEQTMKILPELLQFLKKNNYTIVPVSAVAK